MQVGQHLFDGIDMKMPVPCVFFCRDKRFHDLLEVLNPQFLHVITDSLYVTNA